VAVIGGGNSGVEAAIDLAGIVSHVTLLEFDSKLRADAVLQRKLHSLPNVDRDHQCADHEVTGDGQKVNGLLQGSRHRRVQDRRAGRHLRADRLLPNTDWLKGTIELSPVARSSSMPVARPRRASSPPVT
jgi:alkyl hydroperoxide reductase subunit F